MVETVAALVLATNKPDKIAKAVANFIVMCFGGSENCLLDNKQVIGEL